VERPRTWRAGQGLVLKRIEKRIWAGAAISRRNSLPQHLSQKQVNLCMVTPHGDFDVIEKQDLPKYRGKEGQGRYWARPHLRRRLRRPQGKASIAAKNASCSPVEAMKGRSRGRSGDE